MDKGVHTLLLSHENADVDAVSSLYLFSERFQGDIVLPNAPDRKGRRLADFLELDFEVSSDISSIAEGYQRVVVLDTPDPAQLGVVGLDTEKTEVIDHHLNASWEGYDVTFEDRSSCVEMVYDMMGADELSVKEGTAVIAGILTDTSDLRNADSRTFRTLAEVLELSVVGLDEVRRVISVETPVSEKIARLKGGQRSSYEKVDGWLIARTEVGSFESSVSNGVLGLGADAAFTGSQRGKEFLISGRAKNDFTEKVVGVGDVFEDIAGGRDGVNGGGHPGAAVLSGVGDVREFLRTCLEKVKERL